MSDDTLSAAYAELQKQNNELAARVKQLEYENKERDEYRELAAQLARSAAQRSDFAAAALAHPQAGGANRLQVMEGLLTAMFDAHDDYGTGFYGCETWIGAYDGLREMLGYGDAFCHLRNPRPRVKAAASAPRVVRENGTPCCKVVDGIPQCDGACAGEIVETSSCTFVVREDKGHSDEQ